VLMLYLSYMQVLVCRLYKILDIKGVKLHLTPRNTYRMPPIPSKTGNPLFGRVENYGTKSYNFCYYLLRKINSIRN
jgi:hypothetical protein